MQSQSRRWIIFALVALLTIGLCFSEASAQRKRNKRSRRVTNPVTVHPVTTPQTPASTEPQIISTADQQANEQNNASDLNGQSSATTQPGRRNGTRAAETENQDSTQRTINDLSSQVNKLTDKLNQMEQQQRTLVNLERLTRAEQRAETLRQQLSDAQAKEADLQARLEQINYEIQPENIERAVAPMGTTHPEQAREARRQALENEKNRITTQLNLLASNRQRLESAIVTADAEVDRLRKLVDETNQTQPNTDTTGNTNNTQDTTTTTTTPTNTPAPNNATPPL